MGSPITPAKSGYGIRSRAPTLNIQVQFGTKTSGFSKVLFGDFLLPNYIRDYNRPLQGSQLINQYNGIYLRVLNVAQILFHTCCRLCCPICFIALLISQERFRWMTLIEPSHSSFIATVAHFWQRLAEQLWKHTTTWQVGNCSKNSDSTCGQ